MRRASRFAAIGLAFVLGILPAQEPTTVKVLIAFASYRERPKHPNIFFYEHDGVATGKIVGSVTTTRAMASADSHPSLTHDGRFCAYTFELENNTSRLYFWDRKEQTLVDLPNSNSSPNAQMNPAITGDGKLLAFAALNRPGGTGQGWQICLYDLTAKKLLDLPGLSNPTSDERMPAIDTSGRWLTFVSNRKG